ncbi:MFS transporter [Chitinasiproducens palmae]|uniref:MFS transporter, ACS family, glucarate transporter n=1 Tax=Chitinasiproducens palmae TaxID=1770053 RepID=A0A1H2PLF1_9BURK|nr:MFS transporter [Chitinasiproducens palmae]SDV47236.1 MFS transporter, ACS family, glucarate transporter [Chitinasiproducens palmae]
MKSGEIAIGAALAKPSRVRYWVLAMLVLASAVNLGDRANLSITGTAMSADLGIGSVGLGYVFSAFAWAYVLAQLPAGWLLDRFDSIKVYGVSLVLWSLCTFAQGFLGAFSVAAALAALFVLRFLLGLVESPVSPANNYIVASWFPLKERGLATSIYNSAQYIAVVVFVPLMGLLVHKAGWPSVFYVMGALGLVLAVVWFKVMRNPLAHPRANAAEIDYLRTGGANVNVDAKKTAAKPGIDFSVLGFFLRSRLMVGVYVGQYCLTSLQYFFITWFPIYLVRGRGMNIVEVGFLATLPAIAGFIGGLAGGYLSDLLLRNGRSLSVARKTPFVAGMLLASSLVFCNFVDSPYTVVALMSLAIFGKGLAAVNWAIVSDTSPPNLVGFAGGLFNLFGSLSGIVTPIVVGYAVSMVGSFTGAMYFVAAHGLIGAFVYVFCIGRIHRLDQDDRLTGA